MGSKILFAPGAFRLFLAIVVFVHHSSRLGLGSTAVYLFFALSGFWIHQMWTQKYSGTHNPLVTYAISRAWRLLPNFWLISVIILLTHALWLRDLDLGTSSVAHFVASHILILGYNLLDVRPVGPAWSLDIEMQLYMVAPLLCLLVARMGASAVLVAAAGISLASALVVGKTGSLSFLVFFAAGMFISVTEVRADKSMALIGAVLTLGTIVAVALSPWSGMLLGGAHEGPLYVAYNEPLNVALACLMLPWAFFTVRQSGRSYDGMLSALSYIVYLLHWAGILIMVQLGGSGLTRVAIAVGGWVGVLGASWAIWKIYDRPIDARRSAWVRSRQRIMTPNRGQPVVTLG